MTLFSAHDQDELREAMKPLARAESKAAKAAWNRGMGERYSAKTGLADRLNDIIGNDGTYTVNVLGLLTGASSNSLQAALRTLQKRGVIEQVGRVQRGRSIIWRRVA